MVLLDQIRSLVETEIADSPLFLVDVVGGDRSKKIQVLIDGDEGVTVEACRSISKKISVVIDEDEFESEPFILEISSPGVDKPLTLPRQYKKHEGRDLNIIKTDDVEIVAHLVEALETHIIIEPELRSRDKGRPAKYGPPEELPFEQIRHSTVIISFK